jgi:biotin carboxylase
MINFVHFSPHFPPNFKHFSRALKAEGVCVLGLGDAAWEQLDPLLQNSLTDYYRVDDMHNYPQLIKAMGYFTHMYGKIDGLDSHNEYWLETEARLRTDFNITGIKTADIDMIRKKSAMKNRFREAGLKVVEGEHVTDFIKAKKFTQLNGYPAIVKPDSGVGAADTYKINNETELHYFFDKKPSVPYFIEQFIDGTIQSFDGLVDLEGNLLFHTVNVNNDGVMEVVNNDIHTFYYSLKTIPDDIFEAGQKALKAFNLKGRFFHIEFFRKHQTDELIALEVNMRPPGGYTMDMYNFASDADLYQVWAGMIAKRLSHFNYSRKYHTAYVSRKNHYSYQHSHQQILATFPDEVVLHAELPEIMARAMGNHGYLIRHESLDRLMEIQHFIHETNS